MTVKFDDLDDTKLLVWVIQVTRWNSDEVIKEQGFKMTERRFQKHMANVVYQFHKAGLDKPGKYEIGYECLGEYIEPKELERRIAALQAR